MANNKMFFIILIITVLVIFGLIGCGSDDAVVEGQKVLKVGVMGPFTGPQARTGEEFKGGVEMAFEPINYEIGDYKIEILWLDDESNPEVGRRIYEEAIVRSEIEACLLNWYSSVSAATMDVSAKYGIPHYATLGSAKVVDDKYETDPEHYSTWLKGWPRPDLLSTAYVIAIEEAIELGLFEPRNKKVGIYAADDDWGRSYGEAFKVDFAERGWEIVAEEYTPIGETDMIPSLTRLRDSDASVLAGALTAPDSYAAFIKQSEEVGVEALIIAEGLGWIGEWYEMTGPASNYILDMIPAWTTDESIKFRDEFEAKYGFTPSTTGAALPYDWANFFILVLQKTYEEYGELNSETILQYTKDHVHTGKLVYTDGLIMETYRYTPESIPNPVVGEGDFIFPVVQYFDGEGIIVWPESWKESDLQVPEYLKR